MIRPESHIVLEADGVPVFVVVPYADYLRLVEGAPGGEEADGAPHTVVVPHRVVAAHVLEGKSLIRAWREHKGLTQAGVALRLGVTRSAYARLEKPDARFRPATLEKLAAVLDVAVGQLKGEAAGYSR